MRAAAGAEGPEGAAVRVGRVGRVAAAVARPATLVRRVEMALRAETVRLLQMAARGERVVEGEVGAERWRFRCWGGWLCAGRSSRAEVMRGPRERASLVEGFDMRAGCRGLGFRGRLAFRDRETGERVETVALAETAVLEGLGQMAARAEGARVGL